MYLISNLISNVSTTELSVISLFIVPVFFLIYMMRAHMYYLKYQRYRRYYS